MAKYLILMILLSGCTQTQDKDKDQLNIDVEMECQGTDLLCTMRVEGREDEGLERDTTEVHGPSDVITGAAGAKP
jgi:hypothetical protein